MDNKFNTGDVVYKIVSTDTGGAIVERHTVTSTGTKNFMGTFIEQGDEVKRETQVNIIETDINGIDIFEKAILYCTFQEVPEKILTFLNRKKLW